MNPAKLLGLALSLCACGALAKDEPLLSIGVARVDITPNEPIRLHGYGNRRSNSVGVAQHLFAKALAFGTDREGASILFTVDNLAVSGAVTDEVAARLKKRFGIKREQIALCSSHTHSAPVLSNVAPNIFSVDIIPEQQAAIDRYTRELVDNLERVAVAALGNRAPSKLSWTQGTVNFAKNRRVIREGRAQFGDNDAAPVDHSLPVIFVHGADGKLRAVLVNYACHCTTLGGEWNQVHGDWSGCAQESVERDHPGAIALVSIGCGGDANPSPRGKLENAQAHGDEIATEVRRLLALEGRATQVPDRSRTGEMGTRVARPSNVITKLPDGTVKRFQLDFDPLPTRAQWEERAKKPGIVGYHARKNLARLDRGEKLPTKLPYIVQSWTFGDQLAMVFLAGEVVIDYQKRLKREFDSTRLWVNGYANDVPCYIPSRRILAEGGYEAEDSLWYYDRPARLSTNNEDRIVKAVHDVVPKKFIAKPARAETPQPLSPTQALKSMRVAPEFAVVLAASEPLVVDPVAIDWGADGKLWVAEMRDYPMGIDGKWKPGGVVKFLEDRKGDGRYDKATTFLDGLPFPTGVFAWGKGVLICAAPDIIYAVDTNGDGRADVVRKVFTGFETNNYQARVNSLSLGLDGWVYGANGLLGGKIRFVGGTSSTSATLNGDSRSSALQGELNTRGRDFRMNPDTGAFEPVSGLTQQGRVRDDFGNWFGCDNTHQLWHYPLADEYVRRNPHVAAPAANVQVPQGRDWNRLFPASQTLERFNDPQSANRVTSACGLEIYRDELLGKEFYGNAFTCEPVHNLVHREVLVPDGVTFRSTRATNESNREFLASTDNWFRPVQVRTGPDGALWVVDMYRYVIEHPRWIPSNRLAQLDVRAGANKGRIYRVYPWNNPPRPIRNVAKLSTIDLAAALDSPNGTARDIVHRELLNRGDKSAAPKLLELATTSARPAVRVQAFSVSAALGGLSPEILHTAFKRETNSMVRSRILQLTDRWSDNFLVEAASDRDARLRFQAVLNINKADSALFSHGQLAEEATTNAWMRAAVMSAVSGNSARTFLEVAAQYAEREQKFALVDGLFATMLAEEPLLTTSLAVLPASRADATPWRLRSAWAVLNRWQKKLAAGWPDEPEKMREREQNFDTLRRRMAPLCRRILGEPNAPKAVRVEALKLLGLVFVEESDRLALDAALSDRSLCDAAIDALFAGEAWDLPTFIIPHWNEFSPAQRERILNGLVTRLAWSEALIVAAQNGVIAPAEVSIPVRSQLLASKDAGLRERAERQWPKRTSDRAKLIADYRQAVTARGSAVRGAEVFNNVCASCHVLNGKGTAVGPDLAPFRVKGAEDFLLAILDPNAAIEPRYVNYVIETKSGDTFTGIIRSETATSLEVASSGLRQMLLRTDIANIHASPVSLMPEGLEQGVSPPDMNDLIAYLKQAGPRPFGRATPEEISLARADFMAQQPVGRALLIEASEQLDYPSCLGRLPLWHCRQTDGKSRVVWQVAATSTNSAGEFVVPAALGFTSQPSGKFLLKVNGKSALEFNVALNDAEWSSADGKVRLAYRVLEANSEDSNGLLHLRVAPALVEQNRPVTFEVIGSAANSQRWFGIYDTKFLARMQAADSSGR